MTESGNNGTRTYGLAIATLIFGALSCLGFAFIAGIPAIIMGHVSRGAIARSEGELDGAGLALAGLIMGYASTVVSVIVLLVFLLAAPSIQKAHERSTVAKCKSNMRQILQHAAMYQVENDDKMPSSLDELVLRGLDKRYLTCPSAKDRNEHSYTLHPAQDMTNAYEKKALSCKHHTHLGYWDGHVADVKPAR